VVAAIDLAADATDRQLIVTRVIDAPRPLVFKAWIEPEHVARWWGPQGFTTTFCDMDIRPGGNFRCCMRSPEGTDHWKRGVYREIVAPERIVFTFAWEDAAGNPGHELLTTVSFAEHGTKTKLTLHQAVFETVETCNGHLRGWTSCLERFAEYMTNTERQAAPVPR
jgi:uncharacterized protein YndB with AHSA1/START domain